MYNHTWQETVHVTGGETAGVEDSDDDEDEEEDEDEDADEDEDDHNISDSLEMELIADVKAGDEVWNTYGELSNDALLLKYAFAEAGNPRDRVSFDRVSLDLCVLAATSKAQLSRRLKLWKSIAEADDVYYLYRSRLGFSDELLAYVYTLCATDGDTWQDLQPVEDASAEFILSQPLVRSVLSACINDRVNRLLKNVATESGPTTEGTFASIIRTSEYTILDDHLVYLRHGCGDVTAKRQKKSQ